MRLSAFAIQLNLERDPLAEPAMLSYFPLSFPLADFVAMHWRVEEWEIIANVEGEFVYDGTTYSFTASLVDALVMYGNEWSGRDKECWQVQDTEARDAETDNAVPTFFFGLSTSNQFAMFEKSVDFPYVLPGYWTGENGGAAGSVLPRFRSGITIPIPNENITPSLPGGDFYLEVGTHEAYDPEDWTGGTAGGFTFYGQAIDMAWRLQPSSLITSVTIPTFTVELSPSKYLEFSDGTTPLWHSATGAQLVDPLPMN